MLVIFCLRLAWGLLAALLLLSPNQVNPRFYRVHFLIALGLLTVPLTYAWFEGGALEGNLPLLGPALLLASLLCCFAGSILWSLEGGTAARRYLGVVTVGLLTVGLALAESSSSLAARDASSHLDVTDKDSPEFLESSRFGWLCLVAGFTSAALLGAATTAMLMGHSYLIAPAMSLTPLLRLLAASAVAGALRMAVAGFGLWSWTATHSLANLGDVTVLWLPLRWGLGFLGPLVLVWMAWQSARIRSTQSATGILYVVVIFCFLGELTGQLLLTSTHYPL